MPIRRHHVFAALTAAVAEELRAMEAIRNDTVHEATDADNRAENKYDTRSLEASYLAAGQAERVVALRQQRDLLVALSEREATPRMGMGGVAHLVRDGVEAWWVLLPSGGGVRAALGDGEARIVTPQSPAGRALLGAEEGDDVSFSAAGRPVTWELVAVL